MAGGRAAAYRILGLRESPLPARPKQSGDSYLNEEALRGLLEIAVSEVPSDSLAHAAEDSATAKTKVDQVEVRRVGSWRTGSVRAGADARLANMLYWKL